MTEEFPSNEEKEREKAPKKSTKKKQINNLPEKEFKHYQ